MSSASQPASGPAPATAESGRRNARGEWQPPYPVQYPPLFARPLRLPAILKWVLAFPGFLWPWNSVYFLIALATWTWLEPPLARCATLRLDWIGLVYVRNLALLWLVFGGWHLLLYIWKLQGTERKYDPRWQSKNDPKFLFHDQVYDNVFWSCVSGGTIWTAYEVLYLWCAARHLVPLVDWRTHPIYCVVWLCVIPFWRELNFYWVHRAIHWPPLYRTVHYLHHKNSNPGPWSGLAMHPVEHLLYFSVVLIHFIVPSHPLHFIFTLQHAALAPAGGHHGFEGPVLDGKVPTGSYFHYLHHRFFNCNYGEVILPLDRYFGTARETFFSDAAPAPPVETLDPGRSSAGSQTQT